jgi:hypothetical protein
MTDDWEIRLSGLGTEGGADVSVSYSPFFETFQAMITVGSDDNGNEIEEALAPSEKTSWERIDDVQEIIDEIRPYAFVSDDLNERLTDLRDAEKERLAKECELGGYYYQPPDGDNEGSGLGLSSLGSDDQPLALVPLVRPATGPTPPPADGSAGSLS